MGGSTITGNGAQEEQMLANVEGKGGAPTEGHSTAKRSRKRTSPAASLSDGDILAILESALDLVKQRWDAVEVVIPSGTSTPAIMILPAPIHLCMNCQHLRPSSEMDGVVCQHCLAAGKEEEKAEGKRAG